MKTTPKQSAGGLGGRRLSATINGIATENVPPRPLVDNGSSGECPGEEAASYSYTTPGQTVMSGPVATSQGTDNPRTIGTPAPAATDTATNTRHRGVTPPVAPEYGGFTEGGFAAISSDGSHALILPRISPDGKTHMGCKEGAK